jgi:hypothetical protein
MGELVGATALGRLLSALSGHRALMVAVLVTAWLITGSVLAVTLVALAPSEDLGRLAVRSAQSPGSASGRRAREPASGPSSPRSRPRGPARRAPP